MSTIASLSACLALLLTACASQHAIYHGSGHFASLHPAFAEFERLLTHHAPRAEVECKIAGLDGEPVHIALRSQLLATAPAGVPPSQRALTLIERWHDATYAQLIDDVRVLACFDSNNHIAAYELF